MWCRQTTDDRRHAADTCCEKGRQRANAESRHQTSSRDVSSSPSAVRCSCCTRARVVLQEVVVMRTLAHSQTQTKVVFRAAVCRRCACEKQVRHHAYCTRVHASARCIIHLSSCRCSFPSQCGAGIRSCNVGWEGESSCFLRFPLLLYFGVSDYFSGLSASPCCTPALPCCI